MWNRNTIYESKYFFTFQEVMNYKLGSPLAPTSQINKSELEDFFTSTQFARISSGSPAVLKAHISDLLTLLYERYFDHYVFAIASDTLDDAAHEIEKFQVELISIIDSTYERYAKLLSLYQSEYNKLLDGIKTTTTGVGRFNDTPQNITDGDEFGDNTHLTNITKSTAEATSDADTKINRLDEIQRKFRNLLKDLTILVI